MRRMIIIFLSLFSFAYSFATANISSSSTVSSRPEYSVPSSILQDILETLVEQDASIDIEAIEEDLIELAAHPINLNTATEQDLSRLPFLSPDQIDAILLYCYQHPMHSIEEVQLLHCLKDYEIAQLLPFVTVEPVAETDNRTMADLFRYARHELNVRTDVRNMESFSGDPVYGAIRYKMDAGHKILLGVNFKRDAGEIPSLHSRYGAYLQLNNIGRFNTIVAGDYRASFGYGLVINSALPIGKSSYASTLGITRQGLSKYNGTSQDFLRGAGATLQLGDCRLTAFYSYRQPDSLYRQTAGVNFTYRHNRLMVGATALEYWTKQPLPIRSNYYNQNYFRGKEQFSASVHAQYAFQRVTLLGEVATSQNTKWGFAALLGTRYTPVQDVHLLLLLRHYSNSYDARLASSFSESSRTNAEQGVYLGAEIKRLRYWRFSTYADFFRFSSPKYLIRDTTSLGLDLYLQTDFNRSEHLYMNWRARAKHTASMDKLTFRYQLNNVVGPVAFRTQADVSLCQSHTKSQFTYGAMLAEQIEYRASRIPFTAQLRVEGFYVPHYDSRIYAYENDVLYAYSIPMVYGVGARYYANLRYRFNEHFSLYFKLSDTWYTRDWVAKQGYKSAHRTDLHLLLRMTY